MTQEDILKLVLTHIGNEQVEARHPLPESRVLELYYLEKNWNPKDFARAIEQEHGITGRPLAE